MPVKSFAITFRVDWTGLTSLLVSVAVGTAAYAANDPRLPALRFVSAETVLQNQAADDTCQTQPRSGRAAPARVIPAAICPDPKPALRIETGMHVGPIWGIAADARCRLLVTASSDHTVRLWAMPDARLIRTQYLSAGPIHDGTAWTVALAPDAKLIATSERSPTSTAANAYNVVLFDTATGTHMRRLGSFEAQIRRVAFSADGQRIAVALDEGQGVRVLDVVSGQELMADRSFGGKDVHGVAFSPDGALYAVGYDGFLKHYTPLLQLAGRTATKGGREPVSVAIDSTGRRIAVGYADTSAVEIYDADDLHLLVVANTKAQGSGNLGNVTWSRDGDRLYAAGTFKDELYRRRIFTFSSEGQRLGPDWPAGDSTITSLTPCDDGMAFGNSSAAFGLIVQDDPPRLFGNSHVIDMRAKRGDRFTVSVDGSQLRFDLELDIYSPVLFDFVRAIFTDSPSQPPDHVEPDTTGLPVTGWQNADEPRLSEKSLPLGDRSGRSYALAVQPNRTGFVIGTSSALIAYDATGVKRWTVWGPGAAFGVNLARGGDLVVAAYDDGTFRWYRWSDGRELVAAFIDKDTGKWVAWTPSGYYATSPGGKDLFGWQINCGSNSAVRFNPASKVRGKYERPDIVQRVLSTLDERMAVNQANAARPRK